MRRTKVFSLLLLFISSISPHIYSSPPTVTYNYYGKPLYYTLYMSLQTGLGATDYLKLLWPQQIYVTAKSEITVNLVSFSNNLQVATTTAVADGLTSTTYHVTFGYAIQPSTWYQVQVYPNSATPGTSNTRNLVQVLAVSSYNTGFITYDSNLAFGYINILPALSSSGTLSIVCNSSSSQATVPSAIYSLDIYVTPSIASTTGGNFTLSIYYNSSNALQTTGTTTVLDFTFMGLCQSSATATQAAAVLIFCSISANLLTITFSLSSVTAGNAIHISTSIANPSYYSVRGIQGYWTEFISGTVIQNGFQTNALQVSQIQINAGSPRVLLFWGIESTYSDSKISNLPLFRAYSASPNILTFNSFNIGFSFPSASPITGQYTVTLYLGATGVLEGSIAHNLPAYSGSTVYCYYSTSQIICNNVGAFINTGYRYWISGKAYYNSLTGNSISGFAGVTVTPVVYSSSGALITGTQLYLSLTGIVMPVAVTQEMLDTSGYHNTNTYSIGNAQVISYNDDLTLSSTADAMQAFLQEPDSTIGVVPGLGGNQQLLFLMKTTTSQITVPLSTASYYTINLMFNPQVISFESAGVGLGLDFVGYLSNISAWSISGSPCYYSVVVCEKYNNGTPTLNIDTVINQTSSMDFYGWYSFGCGSSYTSSPNCPSGPICSTECNMFTGLGTGTTDQSASIMAMRQVVFPTGFQSSIYADTNLLDFLFIFYHGTGIASYCLINAYTVTGSLMQNIKAAYVNYYDNSASGNYNMGTRIPMMLRIGGGVLPSESLGATAIGLFFDDNVDATTFYTTAGSSYSIGCTTGSCEYFHNQNINNQRTDNWIHNRRFYVYSLPPIQNEFNILIPVTPDTTNRSPPKYLTIVFFTQTYSIMDVTGLLQAQSVYRIYGPVITGSISGALTSINSLTRVTSGPDSYLATNYNGNLGMALQTSNMFSNPLNNTFTYGNSQPSQTFGTYFGAGYTITSFYYNILASSTLQFDSPPSNTATTCSIFGYVYNDLSVANAYRNGQWVYTVFCPIDSTFNLQSSASNIDFLNPQYPSVFTNNFPLQSVLSIAYSNQNGFLTSNRVETSSITTLVRSCTTSKLQAYNPSSSGKQDATFTFTIPAITLSSSGYIGYTSFRVDIVIPSSTVSSSGLTIQNICVCSLSYLSCSTSGGSGTVTFILTYTGTSTTTVTYFQLVVYALITNIAGSLSTAAPYTVNVYLPQQSSGLAVPFGSSYNTYITSYCNCSSSFTVGITAYGTSMNFGGLTTASIMKNTRSLTTFTFGASSYRDTFYSTSNFVFNWGFLSSPASTYYGRSNYECMIYQGINSSSLALSSSWQLISFSNFAAVTLTPKFDISNPASIQYNMYCYGSGVATGSSTTTMTLSWTDGGNTVQNSVSGLPIPSNYISGPPSTVGFTLATKRFATSGFKSLYSFQVTTTTAITTNARMYFDFHMNLNSRLDNQGVVECYIRTSSTINDATAMYTYCTFVDRWRLMVWNNVAQTTPGSLWVDIFNIDQPLSSNVGVNQIIGLTLDGDSNYTNGVLAYAEVNDDIIPIQSNSASVMKILSVTVNTSYIISPQTITISFDAGTLSLFSTGANLYMQFPSSYSQWISRGQTIPVSLSSNSSQQYLQYCQLVVTGTTVNKATACTFISQRILQITVASISIQQFFTLELMNIMTPASVPTGKYNQYQFKIFVSNTGLAGITYYSFTDLSMYLTLTTNPSLISLSWNYYGIAVSDSLVQLAPLTGQVIAVQIGYYSNVIQLRQSIYPSNFKATMQLALSNYASTSFSYLGGSLTVNLGTSSAYFRIAANSVVSPGLYTLSFTKTGDTNSYYTSVPPLTLVVQSGTCALITDANTYTLPVGGSTLPILINAINCIPTSYVNISVTFSGNNSGQFSVNNDLSSLMLSSSSIDGQLYIVLKHTLGSLSAGASITASFTFSGPNSAYYSAIPSVTLTLVDPTTYETFPTATALSAPVLSGNTASFTLQCSQASMIFWGIGIYPSILNSQATDFEARIISGGNGLMTNFTQSNDYYGKVYGIRQGTTMQVLTKTLYNLESNANYIFKYFCVNQLGDISDAQSINFTSQNYGAYLMNVEITFRGSLNYSQYNDLACSLAQNFIIPYSRVMTEAMSYCGDTPYIFYSAGTSPILNQPDSNGWYNYGFYILPDYTIASDSTNSNIRNMLSINTFTTTIITSTNNYIGLPSLVQMQTYDIQIYTTPIMSISSPLSGLSSVVLTAAITNMNGFIIIGAMSGAFNSSTMTIPSTTNIKQGIFSANVSLLQVQMIHVAQNYNSTFQFTNLTANKLYTFFYFCTVEDPEITALSSSVSVLSAQTLQMLVIDINWQGYLSLIGLAFLVLLF